jgi:hypothetical protein
VTDNYDTGVQSNLIISGSVDTDVVGTYYLSYNATDSEGNTANEVIRTVIVQDTAAPTIYLTGANPLHLEVKNAYLEPGYRVEDNYDPPSYFTVVVSGSVNTGVLGSYFLSYNTTDSNGNAANEVVREVIVEDTTKPVITLSGANPLELEVHSSYLEPGYTITDNYRTNLMIVTGTDLDIDVVGTYTMTYNTTDGSSNTAVEQTRTINVVDTTPPVVTLVGNSELTIEVQGSFSDA